ncbi:MAG: 30S ribosomal protein S21 [Polyangia bacterium]
MIGKPLEVEVRDNLEKAMKILKQEMSKEGILQEVKRRRFYEKLTSKEAQNARARKRRRREMKRRGSGGAAPTRWAVRFRRRPKASQRAPRSPWRGYFG